MAVAVNTTIIAGHLTRDVQVRFLANERAVANFSLAINSRYKGSDGETKEEVTFVDVTVWGKLAELCGQYLAKGAPALCQGKLRTESWEDKEGHKRSKLIVVADSVQFLGGKRADGAPRDEPLPSEQAAPSPKPTRATSVAATGSDEPPFASPLIAEVWG